MHIYIVGPTASGKTALAIALASELNSEIISADSRQCYKYMDIGTAKPDLSQLSLVKHYNISLFDPDHIDNAEHFHQRVDEWFSVSDRKDWIICGGSTLYVQSLLFPLDPIPPTDETIKAKLIEELADHGIQRLYEELVAADPWYGKQMDGMNTQRILRALNIIRQTNRPFSSYHQRASFTIPADTIVFYLHWERDPLIKRITERVNQMIKMGLVEEVRELLKKGYDETTYAMKTVGYKEVLWYLSGNITHTEMVDQIKISTRRYAKRQITWFKRYPFLNSIDLMNNPSPLKTLKSALEQHSKT